MINKVIDGIAESIYNTFGPEHEIYNEPALQEHSPESFSIRCIDGHIDRFLNNKFRRTCLMEINYFPSDALNPRTETQGITDTLFDCLEVIKVSGVKVRGIRANYKIIDNVLVYLVTYIFYTYKIDNIEYMYDLTHDIEAR